MDPTQSPLDQALQQAAAEHAAALQMVGENQVTKEQDAAQQQIDQQAAVARLRAGNAPASYADLQSAERATDPWLHAAGDFQDAVTNTLGNIPGEVWSGFARAAGNIIAALPGTDSASWRQAGEDLTTPASRNTGTGHVVSGLSQFLLSYMPAATGAKLLGAGTVLAGAAGSAVAGIADFNPQDPRLSNLVEAHPALSNPITRFLETQPGDTDAEGRLKNGLEQATLGTAGDALLTGVSSVLKAMRAARSINDDAAAVQALTSTPVDLPAAPSVAPVAPTAPYATISADGKVTFGPTAEGTPQPTAAAVSPQDALLSDFANLPDHPTQVGMKAINGNVAADLVRDPFEPDVIHVQSLRADTPGQGHGTAAMQYITDLADQHGVTLKLDAVPMDANGIDQPALAAFYGKHDFVPAEGGLVEGQAMQRDRLAGNGTATETPAATDARGEAPGSAGEGAAPGSASVPNGAQAQAEGVAAPFNAAEFVRSEADRLSTVIPADRQAALLEALRTGKYAEAGTMLDSTHETIPWDTLSDGDNLKQLFASVEATMGDAIRAAHGTGAVSSDQIQQLAKDIGGNTAQVGQLFKDTTAQGGLGARITAAYNMLLASGRQLKALAAKAYSLDATTPEGAQAMLAFQKQLSLHAAVSGQVRQSSAEIGRALWAHRSLKASSDVALQNIADYASSQLGSKALKQLAQNIVESKGLDGITNASDAVRQHGWKDVLREIAINGMLSSPKTQLVNIAGNASNTAMKIAERYAAATIGLGQRVLGIGSAPATFREAWAHTMGAYDGLKVAWKLAAKAIRDEDFTSQFSQPAGKAIYASTSGRTGWDLTGRQVLNLAGQAVRMPGRIMGIFDHFTQSVGYSADLGARAYVQAAKEADAAGLSNVDRDAFMQQRVAELKANPTTELQQAAMQAGKYNAFLEPAQTVTGGNLSKALNQSPIFKLVVAPFTHRPGNMLRQAMLDYSPLAPLVKSNRQALLSGTSDASVAAARMVIGTSLILEGVHHAAMGTLTGNRTGMSRNTEMLDGIPKYSALLGGKWVKYDRLDPIGTWLGIGADAHEFFTHHYDPTDPHATSRAQMILQSAVQTLGNVAFDKSFLKSADEITSAMHSQDPDAGQIAAQRLITENVSKLLPFSSLSNSVAQAVDPTQRASARGSIFDGITARLPGLTKDLPPRRDLLGRPMPVVSSWDPFGMATASSDPMDKALSALAVHVVTPARSIDGYVLNADEYDDVIRRATQTGIFSGQTLEEKLRDVTSSDAWAQNAKAPDGGVMRNGQEVQKLIDAAYHYGRQSYLRDHPDLVAAKQAQQRAKLTASRPQSFLDSVAPAPPQ